MSTIIKSKKKAVKANNAIKTAKKTTAIAVTLPAGEQKNVAVSEIDLSPLNYRKFYSHAALDDFAAELALHGIISPLTLRLMPTGRYELVAGERRLRAAKLAEFIEVPAVIKVLTDEEVTEIQLAENLQRENPHPMNEAQAIGLMKQVHKTIDEIAARLGKSKTFVYSRVRLLDLITPIQEMFFADVLTIQEAFDIAALSAESQQEFFNQHCINWETEQNFKINNLRYALLRFKYDLKSAPFDTKDKKLVPEMGACTNCPFNSATLKTLFPELAEQAICTKKDCYQTKCDAHYTRLFSDALREHQPQAIIYDWSLTGPLKLLLDSIPGADGLPKFGKNEVAIFQAPVLPSKEDFTGVAYPYDGEDLEDEQEYGETDEGQQFDEAGYNAALYEYEADLQEYHHSVESGGLLKGLLVSESKAILVMYSPDAPKLNGNKASVTAKEVQEAVKAGTATGELLHAEIERINSREERAKELDTEKIQLSVHTAFIEANSEINNISSLTDADLVAARLLVYQSLDWSARNKVNMTLFSERAKDDEGKEPSFYDVLQNLTDNQYSYLIRMAIGHNSESKFPRNDTGRMLLKVAEGAGTDIAAIRQAQQVKADGRKEKLTIRVAELEQKIQKLNPTES